MTESEKLAAPAEETVFEVLRGCLDGLKSVKRTPEGVSTYVYRAEYAGGACYARFLPEDATFGVEMLAHRLAGQAGVPVPQVLLYLPKEPVTGHSLMVVSEIPGQNAKQGLSGNTAEEVLRQAGAALARLHTIPVQGFGWIDREKETALFGERPSFREYFAEFLESDLAALAQCGLPKGMVNQVRGLMEEALSLLDRKQAVLVHGDFCLEHVYHQGGRFTGFIDFGEIQGNNPLFDLGDFLQGISEEELPAYRAVLRGYGEVSPLEEKGRRAAALAGLAFDLRFVGRKAGTPAASFWLDRLNTMLNRVERGNY